MGGVGFGVAAIILRHFLQVTALSRRTHLFGSLIGRGLGSEQSADACFPHGENFTALCQTIFGWYGSNSGLSFFIFIPLFPFAVGG